MKLTFWGAAQTVTGSLHHLTIQDANYLLDCGQFQGRPQDAAQRNRSFPFPPDSIAAVLLSHAHIDHSGNLPSLVKGGFSGPIYSSPATADLCRPMLLDSAHLQEQAALYIQKRNSRFRALGAPPVPADVPPEPLYTVADTQRTLSLFHPVPLHTPSSIGPGLEYQSFEAGHMLGSTTMLLQCAGSSGPVRLAFTGDLGRPGLPIIRDPEPLPPADYLIMESTYGGRFHEPMQSIADRLADIVSKTVARGGKLIVPAFAVGRTQQLVLVLHELINAGKIPAFPIYVDSPLAVNVTEVFRAHTELFDDETRDFILHGQDPFGFARLIYVRDVEQSKALNDLRGPFMVISASGMCEAGRIVHHLKNGIGDPRNTVLLTGYQAQHTLGRRLQEGAREVSILGQPTPVRAEIQTLDALSGHADQNELLAWLQPLAPSLKRIFLVHGEGEGQGQLAQAIHARYGIETLVPAPGQSFDL